MDKLRALLITTITNESIEQLGGAYITVQDTDETLQEREDVSYGVCESFGEEIEEGGWDIDNIHDHVNGEIHQHTQRLLSGGI